MTPSAIAPTTATQSADPAGSDMEAAPPRPVRRCRYTLDELLAQCDFNAPPPADMAIWDQAPPVGKEIL